MYVQMYAEIIKAAQLPSINNPEHTFENHF